MIGPKSKTPERERVREGERERELECVKEREQFIVAAHQSYR